MQCRHTKHITSLWAEKHSSSCQGNTTQHTQHEAASTCPPTRFINQRVISNSSMAWQLPARHYHSSSVTESPRPPPTHPTTQTCQSALEQLQLHPRRKFASAACLQPPAHSTHLRMSNVRTLRLAPHTAACPSSTMELDMPQGVTCSDQSACAGRS